jgi:tRNA(Ser,Leu) C12 N-acetylase TAN1
VQRSKTVNYTNGIFRKVRVPEDVEKKINFRGVPAILVVKMDMMEKQLQDVKFDKLIEESKAFLPANVLHEFKDFTQQLLDVSANFGCPNFAL